MLKRKETVDGHDIEVHEQTFSSRPFWVKVDGKHLAQRGRMRVRGFASLDAAWRAGLAQTRGAR